MAQQTYHLGKRYRCGNILHPTCDKAEKGHLGTLRYQHSGTKKIVITKEASLLTFLRAKNPGQRYSFSLSWNALKMFTADSMRQYLSHHGQDELFYGTVSPGDSLYVPA
eukprot:6480369-Amphidinium_carterae.1